MSPPGASRGKPLLVTAEMPADILAWTDGLRRAYFPPERNRLRAHVTLFHALPPSVEDELDELLGECARRPPPEARVTGLMKLGNGTAIAIRSPGVAEIHGAIADRMEEVLTRQDRQPLRLHVTIQNKVSADAARALQDELGPVLEHRPFRFRGLGLYAYDEGRWQPLRAMVFRG